MSGDGKDILFVNVKQRKVQFLLNVHLSTKRRFSMIALPRFAKRGRC